MADRQSKNIKTGEDDLKNTFLSVSGNSEYMYATGRGSSTIGSDTALAADEGSSFIYSILTIGPENEYDDDQENESDDVPKNESDNDPENDSDDVPENESDDDPENDSVDVPENESDNDPENDSDDVPENESDNDPKNESDDVPENKSDNDPKNESDDGTENESDNDPENDSDDGPEKESDNDPENDSVDVPENESENDPENDSDADPKNESDDGPENESSDDGPENESSDDGPENESDDHPKNESDDHPKNESGDHPKNESDDHPKNEYDDDSENESDDDPEKGTDFDRANMQFLEPEDITPFSDIPKCFMCAADKKHIQATHFCQSCRAEGIYICYECLQCHNRWLHDHIVDTLSVSDASLPRSAMEEDTETKKPEDCEREKVSHGTLQQAHGVQSDSSDTKSLGADASPIEQKTLETVEQEVNSLAETTYSGFNDEKKERFAAESKVKPFFQDKLYSDIIKDMQCMKQESPSKLQKYGTYSVSSQSDTKCSIITSICKLGNGHLVLADSENCMIKILKEDNYQLVSSHKVDEHPALLCFIERGKLAVAFANHVIEIILVEKEIQVKNSFDVKRFCRGLTFGKGHFYVCVLEMIDVYSETGEKKDSFRLSLSSNTDQKFVHLNEITMNKDKDTLYIADTECGIVVADTTGNVKQIIDQLFAKPYAICTDVYGFLFVTEVSTNRVLKISTNDGSVIQVLNEVSKKAHPFSLCHDSITNRLIVGVWCSNDLHVYSCT